MAKEVNRPTDNTLKETSELLHNIMNSSAKDNPKSVREKTDELLN